MDTGLTLDHLRPYRWLILAGVECLSDDQAALIRDFVDGSGHVVLTGNTGWADEWGQPRQTSALDGMPAVTIETAANKAGRRELAEALDGLPSLDTNAPREVMVEVRGRQGLMTMTLVNFGRKPVSDLTLGLPWPEGQAVSEVRWTTPEGGDGPLDYKLKDGLLSLSVPELSAVGLMTIRWGG